MAEGTFTASWVGPGTNTVPFIDDIGGSECFFFDAPNTQTVLITNLGTTGFRFFTGNYNTLCGFVSPGLSHLIGPNAALQITSSSVDPFQQSLKIAAQDVGPGVYHIRITSPGPAAPCAFGTRLKAGFPTIETLTGPIISAAVGPVIENAVNLFLQILHFVNLDVEVLCTSAPPPVPVLDNGSGTKGVDFWLQWFRAVAWPYWCECIPGTPTPIPYPPPVVTLPPSTTPTPPNPCDPADLCGALTRIANELNALQQQNGFNAQLVTLMQRYLLPFAYIRGRRFSTLTSSGTQQLNRSVGLLLEVTAFPPDNRRFLGVPEYIFDLGWVSVLTPDGMIDEIRLTRMATTWLSKLIPSATTIGWGLREGVTIEISELLAEP